MNKNFAQIIIANNAKELDRAFTYIVPDILKDKISLGHRVKVPFGVKYNNIRNCEGFVVKFVDNIDFDISKAKEIIEILDEYPIFSENMIELARWMSEKYYTTLYQCLRCIMPAGISMKNEYIAALKDNAAFKKLNPKQQNVYNYILENGGKVSQRELVENFGRNIQSSLKSLEKKLILDILPIYSIKNYSMRCQTAFLNDNITNFEYTIKNILESSHKNDKQAKVLELLLKAKHMPVSDIMSYLHISASPIKSLVAKNIIYIKNIEVLRNTLPVADIQKTNKKVSLNKEQTTAIDQLRQNLQKKPALICGVTGSGKTEIYMQIIEDTLLEGKSAIMLVPEISLTPQAIEVFMQRFSDKVTVTHSRLSLGERYDQWKKAKDGQVSVILGPRSAIFTPFKNLGAIVIDEEHENTYKSETNPKYDVLSVALKLRELTDAKLVMGSATPSIATYNRAKQGEFYLIHLENRVNNHFVSAVIADMRKELAEGNRSIFSKCLYKAIYENLQKKEQSILFLNRRGHSTFVSCRSCGHTLSCLNCSVNYTYHINSHRLMCHYCGDILKMSKHCPVCGSIHIKYFGIGTQKVEEYLHNEFADAKILRMDLDTTSKKDSHAKIISAFANKEADIMLGTQMIAKGLNFPQVSLVGILAADMALFNGDYRSAEIAYQLMVQVAGRAGRGETKGRVIIQTYNPEHYSIRYAVQNNYRAFYNYEIDVRRQMSYPPFSHIFMLLLSCENEKFLITIMHRLVNIMSYYNKKKLCEVLGPAPAVLSKLKGNYRWKILVKCSDEDILKKFIFYCLDKLKEKTKKEKMNIDSINIQLTLDPMMIY